VKERRLRVFYDVIGNCNCYFLPFWCLNNGRAMIRTSSKHGIIHDLMSHRKTGPRILWKLLLSDKHTHTHARTNLSLRKTRGTAAKMSLKFTKNQCQLIAQYSFLFVGISPTCFGQIYWPSSGSDMQRFFNLRLISCGYNCCCLYGY